MIPGLVGLLSVTTAGSNMTALTVGVEEGVGNGVGLTGHVLAVGVDVDVKGSSDSAGGAPLCANAPIGMTSKPDSSIKL